MALQHKIMKNCQITRHPIRILDDQMQDYSPIGITYINTFSEKEKNCNEMLQFKILIQFLYQPIAAFHSSSGFGFDAQSRKPLISISD